MSVCVVKNSADDYFQKAKQAVEKQDFVQAFRMFRNALAFDNITREKRIEIKKEYAKVLAMRGVFVASNQLLFEVLLEAPLDSEANAILMYNFKATGFENTAEFYAVRAQNFIKEKRENFKDELSKMSQGESLFVDGQEVNVEDLSDTEFDRLINGEFPFLEEENKPNGVFTVRDHVDEFDKFTSMMYEAAQKQEYAKAIDYANDALALNVSEDLKLVAYYTKCVALMIMGYVREALDLVNMILENHPDDYTYVILKAEILSDMKDIDAVRETLAFFEDKPKGDVLPFDRILLLYFKNHLYAEALCFLEPRLPYFNTSESLLSNYGIINFNLGNIDKAKEVFADLNDMYGDLSDAYHYLNYIKYGFDKPIPNNTFVGDITELTKQYISEFSLFLEQEGVAAASWMTMDIDGFIRKLLWIIRSGRVDIACGILKKVFLVAVEAKSQKMSKQMRPLLNRIFEIPAIELGLSADVKETIFDFELLYKPSFYYLDEESKFRVANKLLEKFDFPKAMWTAVTHAVAYDLPRNQKRLKSILNLLKRLNQMNAEKKFSWKSERAIYALILYLATPKQTPPEEIVKGLIYDKNVFEKYLFEYNQRLNKD